MHGVTVRPLADDRRTRWTDLPLRPRSATLRDTLGLPRPMSRYAAPAATR